MELTEVSCSACGTSEAKVVRRGCDLRFGVDKNEYVIKECSSCGLARLSPRPPLSKLGLYYPEQFYTPRTKERNSRKVKKRVEEKMTFVTKYASSTGLLVDIGCAAGEFLARAKMSGWQVHGVEFDSGVAEDARNKYGIPVEVGSVLDVELPDRIDACTLWASLEHLNDPKHALEKIAGALTANGVIIVLVPNFGSLESRLLRDRWPHLDIPRHLYHFTPKTLAFLGQQAGLTVVDTSTPKTHLAVSHLPAILPGWWRLPCAGQRVIRFLLKPVFVVLDALLSQRSDNHTLVTVFSK